MSVVCFDFKYFFVSLTTVPVLSLKLIISVFLISYIAGFCYFEQSFPFLPPVVFYVFVLHFLFPHPVISLLFFCSCGFSVSRLKFLMCSHCIRMFRFVFRSSIYINIFVVLIAFDF